MRKCSAPVRRGRRNHAALLSCCGGENRDTTEPHRFNHYLTVADIALAAAREEQERIKEKIRPHSFSTRRCHRSFTDRSSRIVQLSRLDSTQRAYCPHESVPLYVSVWAVVQGLKPKKYGRFCVCHKRWQLLRVSFKKYSFKLSLPIEFPARCRSPCHVGAS